MTKNFGKLLKRAFACFLVVVMTLSAVPMSGFVGLELPKWSQLFATKASAASTYTEGYYTYTVSNGEATITDCDESISGDVVIPVTLGGYPVTSIKHLAFFSCESLKSVTIPSSVTSIGYRAFGGCVSLTGITVDSNNSYYVSVDGVLFNKNKTTIIRYPIDHEGEKYEIPDSVETIGEGAFEDCDKLISITIPNSVTCIDDCAFCICDGLTEITIPNSVTNINSMAFHGCSNLTDVIIGTSVKSIGYSAFGACGFTEIAIPDSVEVIDENAFGYCTDLKSITIPGSVTSIGERAFEFCISLESFIVDKKNKNYSSKDGVLFDKSESLLIQYPIGNKRSSYSIPDNVTSIGDWAFDYGTDLTSITIPNSVTSIGYWAFRNCSSLTSITIPNSVTSIGTETFSDCCSLTSITIPSSVTSIGSDAFRNCSSLTSITIPNSVTSIENGAFEYCTSLTSIEIPKSVTSIENWAFDDCTSLTDVYYAGSEDDWKKISIESNNTPLTNATIHYNYKANVTNDQNLETLAIQFLCDELNAYGVNSASHIYSKKIKSSDLGSLKGKSVSEIISGLSGKKYVYETNSKGKTVYREIGSKKLNDSYFALTGTTADLYKQCLLNADGSDKWIVTEIYRDDASGFFAIVLNNTQTNKSVFSVGASNGFNGDMTDWSQILQFVVCLLLLNNFSDNALVGDLTKMFCIPYMSECLTALLGDDWGNNDLPLYVTNTSGSQIPVAFNTFTKYRNGSGKSRDIMVTGHSLGAGLATLLSTRYNVEGVLFDSIPMLDVSYFRYYAEMSRDFEGYDVWDFVDIMNDKDVLAGDWEKNYKNYVALDGSTPDVQMLTKELVSSKVSPIVDSITSKIKKCILPLPFEKQIVTSLEDLKENPEELAVFGNMCLAVFYGHDPKALLQQNADGSYRFAAAIDQNDVSEKSVWKKSMSNQTLDYDFKTESDGCEATRQLIVDILTDVCEYSNEYLKNDTLLLGTTGNDNISTNPKKAGNDVAYGGLGNDTINTYDGDDILIGGPGNDYLYGGKGNDNYVFHIGDGTDYITDTSGNDTLSIYGFDTTSGKTVSIDYDKNYAYVYAGEALVAQISKDRAFNVMNSFVVDVYGSDGATVIKQAKIESWNSWKGKTVIAACPVHLDVYNANDELVLTLENKETASFTTDFGVFSVVEGENDELIKVADLYDRNYTVKIVGEDGGEMSYTEYYADENGEIQYYSADNISITDETVINSKSDSTGLNYTKDAESDTEDIMLNHATVIPVTSITLNTDELSMNVGDTFALKADILPANATVEEAVFTSSNTNVATVDDDGIIIATGAGSAEITVDYATAKISCTVTVTKDISSLTFKEIPEKWYSEDEEVPVFVIEDDLKVLKKDTDYQIDAKKDTEKMLLIVTVSGMAYYSGKKTIEIPIVKACEEHSLEISEITTESTCTETGVAVYICSECGKEVTDYAPLAPHSYNSTVTAATCTENGYTTHTCSVCGDTYTDSIVETKGHVYEETVTKATTTADGKAVTSCKVCKASKTVVIPKVTSITLSASSYAYDGKVKSPKVTVKDSKGKILTKNTDYTLTASSGRTNMGRYAVKVTLKGNYSGSKTLYFDIVPAQVTKLKATQTTSSITLSWSKVAGSNMRYYVFSYNPSTKKYKSLGYTTGTSCTVKKLSSGTTYYYSVQAYNTTAKKWGKASATLTTATKPGTPTLKAVAGTKKATLSWNKQNGVTGYVLYMSTSKNGSYSKIATLKGNTKVSYTKTGLTTGKYYYFKVIAYKTVGSTNIYGAYSSVRYVRAK